MNSEISKMLISQKHHDRMRDAESAINSIKNGLASLENEIAALIARKSSQETLIKELKNTIKQNELSIKEDDTRLKKLAERRNTLHSDKEFAAVDKEIEILKNEISQLEESTLNSMDRLESEENKLAAMQSAVDEKQNKMDELRQDSAGRIESHAAVLSENREKFDSTINGIASQFRSRFVKMVNSKEGKAVAPVNGDVCSFCNCKIPVAVSMEASRDDRTTNCTNCGRFIYTEK